MTEELKQKQEEAGFMRNDSFINLKTKTGTNVFVIHPDCLYVHVCIDE